MRVKSAEVKERKENLVFSLLKGVIISLCISLVSVLVFAFLLKFTNISESIITPINQIIKGVSIFLGTFLGLKKEKKMGLISGLLIGMIYTLLAFVVFSALNGSFVFNRTLITDFCFGGIIGAICGIICVNIKKN